MVKIISKNIGAKQAAAHATWLRSLKSAKRPKNSTYLAGGPMEK